MPRRASRLCNSFVDRKRFDIYGKTDLEVDRFSAFVKKLPAGRVVAIAITDTAVAAKRPPSDNHTTPALVRSPSPDGEDHSSASPSPFGCEGWYRASADGQDVPPCASTRRSPRAA